MNFNDERFVGHLSGFRWSWLSGLFVGLYVAVGLSWMAFGAGPPIVTGFYFLVIAAYVGFRDYVIVTCQIMGLRRWAIVYIPAVFVGFWIAAIIKFWPEPIDDLMRTIWTTLVFSFPLVISIDIGNSLEQEIRKENSRSVGETALPGVVAPLRRYLGDIE